MKQLHSPNKGITTPQECRQQPSNRDSKKHALNWQRLKRLLKLCWRQRRGLFYACLGLNIMRLALWLFPFNVVRRRLAAISANWSQHEVKNPISVAAIIWCVTVASYYTPGKAKCLVKALTTQLLLNRYGYSHQLHIGVALNQAQVLEAHAWIEYEEHVIMGSLPDLSRFKPLSSTGVVI